MSKEKGLPIDDKRMREIRRNLLLFFEQNVGDNFRIKGANLVDTVIGVDWEYMHVCGKAYGNFHVDLCEHTNQPASSSN